MNAYFKLIIMVRGSGLLTKSEDIKISSKVFEALDESICSYR